MTNPEKYDLAIVGMGPGGLVAALESAKKGLKVVIFSDRTDYVRGQRLKLSEETMAYLETYAEDDEGKKFLESCRGSVAQTKDIERFLRKKLEKYEKDGLVKVVQVTSEKQSVGKDSFGTHMTCGSRAYYFHHLLAADGGKRTTAKLVEQGLNTKTHYETQPVFARHPYHAAVQLKLRPGVTFKRDACPLPLEDIAWAETLGWDKPYKPAGYFLIKYEQNSPRKFSFAGEIPAKIAKMQEPEKKEQLRLWVAKVIQEKWGINPEDWVFSEPKKENAEVKKKLQATTFGLFEIKKAKTASVALGDGQYFAQIGDARRTPFYPLGHGVNDAFSGAIAFVSCLGQKNKKVTFEDKEFNELINEQDKQLNQAMASTHLSHRAMNSLLKDCSRLLNELIERLDKNHKKEANELRQLRNQLRYEESFDTGLDRIYQMVDKMSPIVNEPEFIGFFEGIWRAILTFFDQTVDTQHQAAKNYESLKDSLKNLREEIKATTPFSSP